MNIHGPSLGIGAAIAAVSVLLVFFVLGSDFGQDLKKDAKTQENDDIVKGIKVTQENSDNKIKLSIFTDNGSPTLGSASAPITIVEFGDYQCFYCNRFFHTTEPDIMKNYIETGKAKMIFKDFTIIGQDSINAAHAAHCADEEGKFWEYHDVLYNNWTGENNGWASAENLAKFAKQIDLDENAFYSCMTDGRYNELIKASNSDARTLGLTGTPGFFIISPDNTIARVSGAQPYDVFEEILTNKLEK